MIEKIFDKSLELIDEINNLESCTAEGIPFVENRAIEIRKTKQNISLTFSSSFSEYSTIDNAANKKLEQINIQVNSKQYIIPSGSLITQNNSMSEDLNCTISSLSVYSVQIDLQERYYYRCLIPIDINNLSFSDFAPDVYTYKYNKKQCTNANLLKITVDGNEYQFWILNPQDHQSYLVIDTIQKCSFETIEKISLDIVVAYGFLCGTIYLDEIYFVAGNNNDFTDLQGIYYKALRDTIKGQYIIFTTNPYSILCHIGKISDAKDGESKAMQKIEDEKWTEKLEYLSEDVFSKLVQEIHDNDAVLRSAMTIVEASKFAIDIQLASYCVVFETLTKYIMKKHSLKAPVIFDKNIWETVKSNLEETIISKELCLKKEQIDFLKKKFNNLSQPTNKDTLMLPFEKLGYTLSPEDIKCIEYRNISLHGQLPTKELKDKDEIDKLFYVNLMFHKLCSILILKLIGFNGYIINNLKIHENNIKSTINEDGFLKI